MASASAPAPGGVSPPPGAVGDARGVALLVCAEGLLAVVNVIVKLLHGWSSQRIMAVRCAVDFVLCLAVCVATGLRPPKAEVVARLLLRGAAYCSFIGFLWAALKSCLPMGDVVVVVTTILPVFLVLLTRLFLGEAIPEGWTLQFVLCVSGALLVNKPFAPADGCPASTTLLPVSAAFAGALMNFASRSVQEVPAPVVCIFNDVVGMSFAVAALALLTPDDTLLAGGIELDRSCFLVLASALIGWAGLICNVKGYQSVSVAAVASIACYSAVPLGYLLQVLVFGQFPDVLSAAGAAIIVCTNVGATVSKCRAALAVAQDDPSDDEAYNAVAAAASPAPPAAGRQQQDYKANDKAYKLLEEGTEGEELQDRAIGA